MIDFSVRTHEVSQYEAFVKPARSQLSVSCAAIEPASQILETRKDRKALPDWVHPKWTKIFLPTLTHALLISKQPFQEFKPSSPIFVATVQKTLKLVYSSDTYNVTKVDVLAEEVSRRKLLLSS